MLIVAPDESKRTMQGVPALPAKPKPVEGDGGAAAGQAAHVEAHTCACCPRQSAAAAIRTDGLAVGCGLAAGLDDGYVKRPASGGEPKDRPDQDGRDEDHRDEHKRLDAPQGFANARGDLRLLRLVDEIAAARADEPGIVRLEYVTAVDPFEGNLFKTVVKTSHGSLPCGAHMRRLSLCRTNPARGSKLWWRFARTSLPGRLDPAVACYFLSIGVMWRSFLATFQLP
jgi:hypothetical protein